jgi:hypothetical protein
LFLNVPSLTINALAGSDQITLQTPAPNPVGQWGGVAACGAWIDFTKN